MFKIYVTKLSFNNNKPQLVYLTDYVVWEDCVARASFLSTDNECFRNDMSPFLSNRNTIYGKRGRHKKEKFYLPVLCALL
jgi:hypothetical protein